MKNKKIFSFVALGFFVLISLGCGSSGEGGATSASSTSSGPKTYPPPLPPDYPAADYPLEKMRDPAFQPYHSTTPWNTPIGSGAQWSAANDPDTIDVQHPKPALNSIEWSMPVYLAKESDPVITIDNLREPEIATFQIHLPANAQPANAGDKHIIAFSPDKKWVHQLFGCDPTSIGFNCKLTRTESTCGDGLGGYSWGTGVIRAWEIKRGVIQHMLRYSLPVGLTKSGTSWTTGLAWPASKQDYNGEQTYTGNVLFGSTVGIPAWVDLKSLGLSRGGMMIARALQDYGAMQRDTGGSNGIIFYAEQGAAPLPEVTEMRRDLPRIVPYLRVMRNQAPESINGGGTRRVALPPPLDPAVCP